MRERVRSAGYSRPARFLGTVTTPPVDRGAVLGPRGWRRSRPPVVSAGGGPAVSVARPPLNAHTVRRLHRPRCQYCNAIPSGHPGDDCGERWAVDVIAEILRALDAQVKSRWALAEQLDHDGERGHAREDVLRGFITELLPESYGASTGFVVDANGSISNQVDLVVYRRDYAPLFHIETVNVFMVESVVAVAEIKSTIKSRDKLALALDNVRSVKALDRSNGGSNYIVGAREMRGPVDPQKFSHQVFGAVVTGESLSRDSLRDGLLDYVRSHARTLWWNAYVDINGSFGEYLQAVDPSQPTVIPADATHLMLTRPGSGRPLLDFAFELVNFLRVAPIIDFKPTSYLGGSIGVHDYWPL